jgi:hypothetical protein
MSRQKTKHMVKRAQISMKDNRQYDVEQGEIKRVTAKG